MKHIAILSTVLVLFFASCHNEKKADTDNQDTTANKSLVNEGVQGTGLTQNTNQPSSATTPQSNTSTSANPAGVNNNVEFVENKPYYISGRLIGGAGGTVILDELGIGKTKPLFSQTINPEEQYDFEGTTDQPVLLQLRLPNGRIHLVVYPGDTITVASTLAHPENFTAGGSVETMRLKHMYEILEAANAKKRVLKDEEDNIKDKSQLAQMSQLHMIKFQQIEAEKRANLEKYMNQIDTSFVCVLASLYLDPETDFDFMEKIDKKFANRTPHSTFYQALHQKVVTYGPVQVGHYAPEILSTTPDNKTLRLSSLRGKYVLVDFWASWCQPCRQEMPRLSKLYDKYKNKNFEILGVSLDDKKADWMQAIQDDKMSWKQVSDLSAFSSASAQTYLVSAIPMTFLIGPDGKIIAKNLRGPDLDEKLAKLIK